jgi:uncharacterized membrane protein YsdA (DUF1294 family)
MDLLINLNQTSNILLLIFVVLNITTFLLFGADKYLAITKRYRIREKTLLILSGVGGSIGAIVGQYIFRHKTIKFKWILWIILFVQLLTYTYISNI